MYPRLLLRTVCALLAAAPCGAQTPVSLAWATGPIESADALYFVGQAEEAFEILREHLSEEPEDYEALWRVVRSTLSLGNAAEGWLLQNSWLDTGMDFGGRAVAIHPDGVEGRYWRGAVTGRRALNAVAEYGAELAQQAYEDARAILSLQPDHAGAHNILGRIFFEIMSMSRIERFIGRTFVRTDALRASSWEESELHLEAATAASPDRVLFQHNLAELYRKRGREEEARAAYMRVTHMLAVHPSDAALQEDASRVLEELDS
jgi:tetratricopeptide (TPR) repeat protein